MNFTAFQPEERVFLTQGVRVDDDGIWDNIRDVHLPANATARWIVGQLARPISVDQLTAATCERFAIDRGRAYSDVNGVLETLNGRYLLRSIQPWTMWLNLATVHVYLVSRLLLEETSSRYWTAPGSIRGVIAGVSRSLRIPILISLLFTPILAAMIWSNTTSWGEMRWTRLHFALFPFLAMSAAYLQTIAHELGHLIVSRRLGSRCHVIEGRHRVFITHQGIRSQRDRRLIALSGPALGMLVGIAQAAIIYGAGWVELAVAVALMAALHFVSLLPFMADGAMFWSRNRPTHNTTTEPTPPVQREQEGSPT